VRNLALASITVLAGLLLVGAARLFVKPPQVDEFPKDGLFVHDASPILLDYRAHSEWKLSHEFHFENPYDARLALNVVDKSCGCADCEVVTPIVDPDQIGIVRLSFAPAYRRTRRFEMATLSTGITEQPTIRFYLGGEMFPRILVHSATRNIDVEIDADSKISHNVRVSTFSTIKDEESRLVVSCTGDISCERSNHLIAKTSYGLIRSDCIVSFGLNSAIDPGQLAGADINWRYQDATLESNIVFRRESVIQTDPKAVYFNSDDKENTRETIRLVSLSSFQITGIQYPRDVVEVRTQDRDQSRECQIEVSLVDGKLGKDQNTPLVIRVETDSPEQPIVSIELWIL
jgi:hypothetical protein